MLYFLPSEITGIKTARILLKNFNYTVYVKAVFYNFTIFISNQLGFNSENEKHFYL